jgi:biotin carboxyl carrier protein
VFDEHDREVLEGLAASAAIALRNAQLVQAEKRARDLEMLLEISREITSTLDLDRVLQSVVNLAARALPFDQAAIGLFGQGDCEIRAIAGEETVDPKDDRTRRLAMWGEWVARRGEPFYLSDRNAPGTDAEVAFVNAFGEDLAGEGLTSGYYLPLADEQGLLGVLIFESKQPEFLSPTQRELAEILANQTTVALRNAELYHEVPMVDALGALGARRKAWLALPRQRRMAWAVTAALVIGGLVFVRWPLRVVGDDPSFRAASFAEVHALVPGVLERVMVREGSPVARGAALAKMRDADLVAERAAALADADGADRMAATAASRGDAAGERVQRARAAALRQQSALLDEEIAATTLLAPVAGVILTPRPEQRVGAHFDAGDALLSLGRTDTLELDFGVAQKDIERVTLGQPVHARVDAIPQRTFDGVVSFIGPVSADTGSDAVFPVRALMPNPYGLLRPGMVAHARVLTASASIVERVFRGPWRWIRLAWWRIWA